MKLEIKIKEIIKWSSKTDIWDHTVNRKQKTGLWWDLSQAQKCSRKNTTPQRSRHTDGCMRLCACMHVCACMYVIIVFKYCHDFFVIHTHTNTHTHTHTKQTNKQAKNHLIEMYGSCTPFLYSLSWESLYPIYLFLVLCLNKQQSSVWCVCMSACACRGQSSYRRVRLNIGSAWQCACTCVYRKCTYGFDTELRGQRGLHRQGADLTQQQIRVGTKVLKLKTKTPPINRRYSRNNSLISLSRESDHPLYPV